MSLHSHIFSKHLKAAGTMPLFALSLSSAAWTRLMWESLTHCRRTTHGVVESSRQFLFLDYVWLYCRAGMVQWLIYPVAFKRSSRAGSQDECEVRRWSRILRRKNWTSLLVNSICCFRRFVPSNTFMLIKSKKFLGGRNGLLLLNGCLF